MRDTFGAHLMAGRATKIVVPLAVAGLLGAGIALYFWWKRPVEAVTTVRSSQVRSARRAYEGAPPVIPHPPLGAACVSCHTTFAREIAGVGLAPPNPHLRTVGLSETARCQQCHVFQNTEGEYVASTFPSLKPATLRGERLYPHAPPVVPHHIFMREDCVACHASDAGRPEIRCTHPERTNCLQCHATLRTVARDLRNPVR